MTDIQLTAIQQEAVNLCTDLTKRVVCVVGEAGTGKTTIIKETYKRLTSMGYKVLVTAPTGKAARRVTEVTGITAMTNHRALGYGMPTDEIIEDAEGKKLRVKLSTGPRYTRQSPLDYDVLICDEYPMVNREIHANLVAALRQGAQMRVFGDPNQLMPIEENKLLRLEPSAFHILLDKFPPIRLTQVHRQVEGNAVLMGATRILQGKLPERSVLPNTDMEIIYTDTPTDTLLNFLETHAHEYDFSRIDHQIITGMNKSWVGTVKLNALLQDFYWDTRKPAMGVPRPRWAENMPDLRIQEGSKVVFTTNAYDLGNGQSLFNGEVGIVQGFDAEVGMIDIDFGDRIVSLPPIVVMIDRNESIVKEFDPRTSLDLAYALTTHKMQGSEVQRLVYMLNKSTRFAQNRRNFYTAITRARTAATIITDQASIMRSITVKE